MELPKSLRPSSFLPGV